MLEKLFPSAFKVHSLETEISNNNEDLKMLREELAGFERKQAIRNELSAHTVEIIKRDYRDAETHKEREHILVQSEIETEAEIRIARAIDNADIAARAKVQKEVEQLKSDLELARVEAAKVNAITASVTHLQDHIFNLKSIIASLMEQLPKVDMSKFAVNVNVEPADITVTGGQVIKKV